MQENAILKTKLLQRILRTEISKSVVQLKAELEKIREQVQNVE